MFRRRLVLSIALLGLLAALPLVADGENTAEMEAWTRAMTPARAHAELAKQAGEWRYVVTFWDEHGGEPSKLDGVALKTMIMGGRYLKEELTGEFQGRRFQGFGISGYDNVTRELVSIWLDNMSTGIAFYTGHEDSKGVQTFSSTQHDPLTGNPIPTRSVGRVIDHDHHTFESFVTLPNGDEHLQMRVEYTRATR